VLQIGKHQLLVLLLVVETQLHDVERRSARAPRIVHEAGHATIHVVPILEHFPERGAREQSALGPGVPVADGMVVRVEQHAKLRMEVTVIADAPFQHEGFEEPGGVSEMPFDRARIRHRLQRAILGR
jgi:hypothetical protein